MQNLPPWRPDLARLAECALGTEYGPRLLCPPDGNINHIYNYAFIDVDGCPLVLEMGIGITDRKQAQETLRESEERLRLTSKQSITAQERERQRLSLELHDDPGQLSWQDMS